MRRSRPSSSNKIRGTFNSVAVKAPGFGDRRKAMLGDIAILTGGQVISEEVGLKLENGHRSTCSAGPAVSSITKDDTTIIDGGGQRRRGEGPDRADQAGDRGHRLGLGPREAPGASRQARRRRCRRARSAPPPRSSSRRRSTASRTPSRRRVRRSRRASSPAAAPPSSAAVPAVEEGSRRSFAATRRPVRAIVAKALEEPLKWIAINAGLEGAVHGAAGRGRERRTSASTRSRASSRTS